VLSQSARGASRFRLSLLCSSHRSVALIFGTAILALMLISGTCAPAHAQAPDQNQPQAASSSSAPTPQESQALRRSYQNRRLMTKQTREAQAVTETYTHRWEVYSGGEYMRFRPGPHIHNSGMGGWTLGFTRYFNPRLAITADAQGYYGDNSLGATGGAFHTFNSKFDVFPFTIGPEYRFYGTARLSVSGAVQAGIIYGFFDKNTNGIPPELVGFYPASVVGAAKARVDLDYNLSPALAVRISPFVLLDHFGGNYDHNQGFMLGVVYRLGRQ
jgi:hypothetical protein